MKISTLHDYLKACGTPVHKLDTPLALDGGDSSVDILGHHVASVEHAASHVLAMPWVALHHGVCWLKASIGDLSHAQRLMIGLLSRDNRSIGDEGKVNPEQMNKDKTFSNQTETYLG